MFKVFDDNLNSGFHVTFENGYTVSVQFAPMNYCDPFKTCEIAVLDKDHEFVDFSKNGYDILAYQTPNQMLEIMNNVASFPSG